MTGNFAVLEELVHRNEFDFVILSETHITADIRESEYKLTNYRTFNCLSNSRHTGGVTIFVNNRMKAVEIKSKSENYKTWILMIKMKCENECWNIIDVYRSDKMSVSEFNASLSEFIESNLNFNENVCIVGDFNIDYNINSGDKRKFEVDILNKFGLMQLVKDSTRNTRSTSTLIDYVLSDYVSNIKVEIKKNWIISDHETIKIELPINKKKNESQSIKYVKYDKVKFLAELRKRNFVGILETNNTINMSMQFKMCIELSVSSLIKSFKTKSYYVEWFNDELSELKQNKIRLYKLNAYLGTSESWEKYRKVRNKYKNKCVEVKNSYIEKKIEEKAGNQKAMWKVIKKYVLSEVRQELCEIEVNNIKINNNMDISNKLNEFFVDSVIEINESIPDFQYNDNIRDTVHIFEFRQINTAELEQIIKNSNNKNDFNGLNTNILLDCKEDIFPVLLHIINTSLMEGIFPSTWKESIVVPVEKEKNAKKPEQFRPINMMPVYEKILEKVVCMQLECYFTQNGTLCEEQSGFRKGHSTETALAWVLNEWKREMDDGNLVLALFLDLKRAFETVDRSILLNKLFKYGIRQKELRWFESFLSARTQRIKLGEVYSSSKAVNLGVPQGTILGVILFLVYVNDIKDCLKFSKVSLFADDTLVYIVGKNLNVCENNLNSDADNLFEWLCKNKLKLNIMKTKCMCICSRGHNINIKISNNNIECVEQIKYLGVIVDNKLSFNAHADFICSKISKKINFLYRIRKRISTKCAINIYNSIILPHIDYCSSILYLCSSGKIDNIQILQNRAMRCVLKCGLRTHIVDMLNELKWMSIVQRLKFNALIFIFKLKNGLFPIYLQRNLQYVGSYYNLRNVGNFRLPLYRRTSSQNNILYKGMQLFNNLDVTTKMETNIIRFKKQIEQHIVIF